VGQHRPNKDLGTWQRPSYGSICTLPRDGEQEVNKAPEINLETIEDLKY
jgi:hypothetical protein